MISIFLISIIGYLSPPANYPIPNTEHLLFYIQRNHNANTIVYDANFDENGDLDPEKPMDVYWLRYDEDGQRMKLRTFEKWYVFGVSCETTDNEYDYRMKLAAKGSIKFWLKQTAPFKAEIITDIGGIPSKLDHLFVTLDKDSFLFKVKYGEFFGTGLETNNPTYFKIIP